MSRPAIEVADIIRSQGSPIPERLRIRHGFPAAEGFARNQKLPDISPGRPYRCLSGMRASGQFIQLMPQSEFPECQAQ